jgi:hypothetical protein
VVSSIDHTNLSLRAISRGLDAIAAEAQTTCASLDAPQLNWRLDAAQWSVGQCFDHLLQLNQLMLEAADRVLITGRPRSFWQFVPVLPGVLGRMLIRFVSPAATRKFKAPAGVQPGGEIPPDVVPRFVAQHRHIVSWLQTVDERQAARTIMVSPFSKLVAYSVLDGFRLVLAHDRRHLEQAHRVMGLPGFPGDPPGI